VCRWQVKPCDALVTHGPYLSALAVVLSVIRRWTNHQITVTYIICSHLRLAIVTVRYTCTQRHQKCISKSLPLGRTTVHAELSSLAFAFEK